MAHMSILMGMTLTVVMLMMIYGTHVNVDGHDINSGHVNDA